MEAIDVPSELRPVAERLVAAIEAADPRIERGVKWGQLTFTVNGNWHHWVCAVRAAKGHVSLVMHKGAILDDPSGMLSGSGKYSRQARFTSPTDIDATAVTALVRQGIKHQTEMPLD
jgi:hypothetical protein